MRIEQLTFTRFLAAISIVIFHYGDEIYLFHNKYTEFIFGQANIGVSYFFILSGFVMIIAYNNKSEINFFQYLKNRLARIYPVYLLAIFLMVLLSVLHKSRDLEGIFLSVFMIQAWVPSKVHTINGPGWSISVEFLFYIIFPFLFNSIYKKMSYKTIIWPIIIIWIISQIASDLMFNNIYINGISFQATENLCYFPLLHVNEFLIGNLAGLYFVNNSYKIKNNYDWQIIGIVVVFALFLKFPINWYPFNGIFALLFVPLIILISSNNGKLTTLFNKKIFVFLGEISFGVYILQKPVFKWLSDKQTGKYFLIDKIDNVNIAFFIKFFFLILLASLSYIYFEKPIREKIKNIF